MGRCGTPLTYNSGNNRMHTMSVKLAPRELVRKEDQRGFLTLEGKIRWEGDLDEVRKDRFSR